MHQFISVANAMESAAMAPTYLPPTLGALPTTSTVSINVSPTKIPMNLSPNAASSPMTIPAPTTATYSPTAQSLMDLALPALVVSLSLLWGYIHPYKTFLSEINMDSIIDLYANSISITTIFKSNKDNCEIEHTHGNFVMSLGMQSIKMEKNWCTL